MSVQKIWDKILKLSQELFVPVLKADAVKFGFEDSHATHANIEDTSLLTLIWVADYAARKQGKSSIFEALLNELDKHGLYMNRLSRNLSAKHPPCPPGFTKDLYEELAQILERTLPARNQIGFAFFQNALGKVGFFQSLRNSSRGKKYKGIIESCIKQFEVETL